MSLTVNVGDAVIRSAPVAVAATAEAASRYMGLTLHEWFYVATISYVVVQCWALIYKTLKGGPNV